MKTALSLLALIPALAMAATTHEWEARTQGDRHFSLRAWVPDGPVRAIAVLSPGLNGDGRTMANDAAWQDFASRNGCALVALNMRGSGYYMPSGWTGKLLLDGINHVAKESERPELAAAPLLLWGHSAGGQFNYNFTAWKPARVAAFILNKGGYYDERMTSSARKVPGLCILGANDTEVRVTNIRNLFEDNRRSGANWGLLTEPNEGHGLGRSREIAMTFFEDVLAGAKSPWLGNNETGDIQPNKPGISGANKLSWFPGEATAQLWQEISGFPKP